MASEIVSSVYQCASLNLRLRLVLKESREVGTPKSTETWVARASEKENIMADTKRNVTAGKVATLKSGGQPMQDTLSALSTSIGARIKVTTVATTNSVLEGTLFTFCPILNVLAINTTPPPPNPSTTLSNQPGDYHIIPVPKIQDIQILSLACGKEGRENGEAGSFANAVTPIGKVDTKRLKEREATKIRKLQEEERKRNPDVGPEAQSIFNTLDRMYSTRWHGTDIIVMNDVIISAPYTSESARAPREKQQSLAHIQKVLDGERRKMERARSAGASPAPRKGG